MLPPEVEPAAVAAGGAEVSPLSQPAAARNVLVIAYHFPPQAGSSGLLRSLKFCRYLLDRGWRPTVLSCNPRAYERLEPSQLAEIPPAVEVLRAFALDTRRHLAVRGRYPRLAALPDRWVSWCLGAVPAGLRAIRRKHVDVIYCTFPIATAVLIGFLLHRLSGKPWVVDFRDSMTEEDYPPDPGVRRVYRWIERRAVRHAARLLFTTPSTRRMYLERYPSLDPARCLVVPNGYDEEDFRHLPPGGPAPARDSAPLCLLHAGIVYPWERDPKPFFRALARLKREGKLDAAALQVNLRGAGNDEEYSRLVRELQIDDLVHILPTVPYREVLQEGAAADAVLLLQAANCNHQIPAKVYEYLRLGKPILALTDHAGDTAALLRESGGATILDIADEQALYAALPGFLASLRERRHPVPDPLRACQYSRRQQAYELARCLDAVS